MRPGTDHLALPLAVSGAAGDASRTRWLGVSLFRDGAGRAIRAYDVAADLPGVPPPRTYHRTFVGLGVVGWVSDYPAMGVQTGRMVTTVPALRPALRRGVASAHRSWTHASSTAGTSRSAAS